jgi:hypothetical protein
MQEFNLGSFNDLEPVNIRFDDDDNTQTKKNSVNFGTGIELLMNDKKRSNSSSNIDIDLGELDQLESELNELSGNTQTRHNESKTLRGFANNLFDFSSKDHPPIVEEILNNDSNLGNATANSVSGISRSTDGFSKMNEIPFEFNNKISDREKRRKKRMMIKKLEEWHEKGFFKNSSNFNIDSPYEEVEDEYESALENKRKKDSIKVQGWWFMTFVHSVEYANAAFDPFDINLDGWGEQINDDLDSYDEIFTELYQKYKGGKIAPEISLLLRLGFSASVVAFTNRSLSTATPAFNDVIRQSPELMKAFTNATVKSMSATSPGFGFANAMANKDDSNNNQTSYGPPPAPIETKLQPPSMRQQRPDIIAGRGVTPMFREQGINIQRQETIQRPEMRGPQNIDIDNLLSGLKTKESNNILPENDSMISATSMRDMMGNNNKPKRSNKRKSSEKNTISLDI